MPEPRDTVNDLLALALIEHCATFAEQRGVDAMLDLIAGVHQAYARLTNDPVIKAAYELAGVPLH